MYSRPGPQWFYEKGLKDYKKFFGKEFPEWARTLDNESIRRLFGVCKRLKWPLPRALLVGGETRFGEESLWSERRNRLDFLIECECQKKSPPRDLQNLPFDPAKAAGEASLKRKKKSAQPRESGRD